MYAIGRQKSKGVGVQEGWSEKKGGLCDICHFDPGDLAVVCRGFPAKFFPLDFENKFSCFFDIGERFFPGFGHHRIFHWYALFMEDQTIFPLGLLVPDRVPSLSPAVGGQACVDWADPGRISAGAVVASLVTEQRQGRVNMTGRFACHPGPMVSVLGMVGGPGDYYDR